VAVFATVAIGGSAGAASARATCPNATVPATQVSLGDLRKSIQCLANQERRSNGRTVLQADRRLAKAAKNHLGVMVATDCLDHLCGNEPVLEKRIRKAGYFSGARSYDYAENVGCEQTTAQMVANWMASPLHRKNLLDRKLDEVGVAVTYGRVPSRCYEGYVTFVAVFGHRSPG
jgi:uncharacterized protein YkwD